MLNVVSKPASWHYVAFLLKGGKLPPLKPSKAIEDGRFKVLCWFFAACESFRGCGRPFYMFGCLSITTLSARGALDGLPCFDSMLIEDHHQHFLGLTPGRRVNLAAQRGTEEDIVRETLMFKTLKQWLLKCGCTHWYIWMTTEPSSDIIVNVKYGSNESENILLIKFTSLLDDLLRQGVKLVSEPSSCSSSDVMCLCHESHSSCTHLDFTFLLFHIKNGRR